MSSNVYVGTELDAFAHARNWKKYIRDLTDEYLRGDVLEVGAGIGETSSAFRTPAQTSWTALEPDLNLARRLRLRVTGLPRISVIAGSVLAIKEGALFDCVIYMDVLEHIEQDRQELLAAAARLKPYGTIVVLSPAHQALFTPFDAAIGHYRRYDRRRLAALTPPGTRLIRNDYLDSVGLTLTIGNRLLLRSATPTVRQVLFWDRFCVPIARRVDPLFFRRIGKSVLTVWRRQ